MQRIDSKKLRMKTDVSEPTCVYILLMIMQHNLKFMKDYI
jgi:hypothetical protein